MEWPGKELEKQEVALLGTLSKEREFLRFLRSTSLWRRKSREKHPYRCFWFRCTSEGLNQQGSQDWWLL